jgi:signal transduction histidine kinase
VRRIVPALEALLAAARDREALHAQTVDLARQQMALRRVATLVASRAEPDEVNEAVVVELTRSLGTEHVSLVRFEDETTYEILAVQDATDAEQQLLTGERLPVGGHNVCTLVHQTGEAVVLDYTRATGPVAERLRPRGFTVGIGVPITVEGRTWGALAVGVGDAGTAHDLCEQLADFADLVATSVDNAETRAQLTRSRARVVAAGDQARRTIERDLHDGAQQRIVSLGLDLRAAQASVPVDLADLRARLDRSVDVLSQIHHDLQELSRGIHPAILSRGGLAAALKTLARRSPVPVSSTIDIPERLPDAVEVAAYYAVAEALTNTAKHAQATEVTIRAEAAGGTLEVVVADDGVGGAQTGDGSGLIGLHDRIDAAGGALSVSSPVGGGTTLTIYVPYGPRG